MSANQARFRVATMARVLGVSPSGYYAWRRRPPSARAEADAELTTRVREIHARSRGTYGAPRIHADLADDGVSVGRKRVARVMRAAGIAGVSRRRGPRTTRRAVRARPAPDRVERRFEANEPNRLWAADITYVPTLAGFLYLAIVLDVFSRRVVGWAMAAHLRTALVIEALEMAIAQRRPEAVVHHSDQGCQYTSLAFGARCREWGVALSMGSVGDCFDNAVAESFFATLECELLDRTRLSTHAEARAAVFEFIEGWYNTRRRHSVLGYRSPLEFERLHAGPVDGARPVDALRAPTSPLDPALRAASTPPTGNDVDVQTHDVNSQALTCPRDRGNLRPTSLGGRPGTARDRQRTSFWGRLASSASSRNVDSGRSEVLADRPTGRWRAAWCPLSRGDSLGWRPPRRPGYRLRGLVRVTSTAHGFGRGQIGSP